MWTAAIGNTERGILICHTVSGWAGLGSHFKICLQHQIVILFYPNLIHTDDGRFTHQSKIPSACIWIFMTLWQSKLVRLCICDWTTQQQSICLQVEQQCPTPSPYMFIYTISLVTTSTWKYLIAQYHQLFCQNLLPQYPLVSHLNPTPQSQLTDQS